MKRTSNQSAASPGRKARQPVVIREMSVEKIELMLVDESSNGSHAAPEGGWILRPLDDGVREVELADLRLEFVTADIGVVRFDSPFAECLDFRKGGSGRAGPTISGGEVEDLHAAPMLHFAGMAIDTELLEILACPLCKQEVKLIPLSEARRAEVRDKYREKFRGEEPVVEQGLQCVGCHRIYPIVSDIPVMLVDEAFDEA